MDKIQEIFILVAVISFVAIIVTGYIGFFRIIFISDVFWVYKIFFLSILTLVFSAIAVGLIEKSNE